MEIVLADLESATTTYHHFEYFLFVTSLGLSLHVLNWMVPYGTPIFVVHELDL